MLPSGQRHQALAKAGRAMFAEDSEGRVLPFDPMIAAIARSLGASVVTRNTADFDGCAVEVINPWQA